MYIYSTKEDTRKIYARPQVLHRKSINTWVPFRSLPIFHYVQESFFSETQIYQGWAKFEICLNFTIWHVRMDANIFFISKDFFSGASGHLYDAPLPIHSSKIFPTTNQKIKIRKYFSISIFGHPWNICISQAEVLRKYGTHVKGSPQSHRRWDLD